MIQGALRNFHERSAVHRLFIARSCVLFECSPNNCRRAGLFHEFREIKCIKSSSKICLSGGNKSGFGRFTLVCVAPTPQPATFEELAMPLFEQLYNFAHWLSKNREEAEDLVQETYAKALRRILFVPAGYELPRLDVPHPA